MCWGVTRGRYKKAGDGERMGILQTSGVCCIVWEFRFTLISYLLLFVLETMGQAFEEILD